MLDLARLQRIHLTERPLGQRVMAELGLRWDYLIPRRTDIILEGLDNLPQDRSVFIAMNHTDRYNYWPFQFAMHCRGLRYTATWVKGKYYENALMAWFMDSTNNIPLPSRGYVISTLFRQHSGRKPSGHEYRQLRALVDGKSPGSNLESLQDYLASLGGLEQAGSALERAFSEMMAEVMRITGEALDDARNHVLVFPQGTRSKRLLPGHIGLAQAAQHLGVAIVPVGCNGSDGAYPGAAPFSKGGRIVYRIGRPIEVDGPELDRFRVTDPFVPFTRDATQRHGQSFREITDVVTAHIDELLDAEYRLDAKGAGPEEQGVERFV